MYDCFRRNQDPPGYPLVMSSVLLRCRCRIIGERVLKKVSGVLTSHADVLPCRR